MELVFEKDTLIESGMKFKGCVFGKGVLIEKGVTFNVIGGEIGDRTIIRSGARVEGNSVVLGRESYLDRGAWIGGGSCFDRGAFLNTGDWFHMGWNSQVNIARGVEAGHEVGIGIETKIFTHGAYLPVDFNFPVQWAPVKIGSRVWLPNAWVNPGVRIGDDVVVGARSLINSNLPDNCFAAGVPAKVLREGCYNKTNWSGLLEQALSVLDFPLRVIRLERTTIILVDDTEFDLKLRTISGRVTSRTEQTKNQLRRNGIRFRFTNKNNEYVAWDEA